MLYERVIDALIAGISNKPGEDQCVILVGWPDAMSRRFEKYNSGLQRRFNLDATSQLQHYDSSQLGQILDLMLSWDGLAATEEAQQAAIKVLSLERDQPNFGNGKAVQHLLNKAKVARYRRGLTGVTEDIIFTPLDLIPTTKQFPTPFQRYQNMAAALKSRGKDPQNWIPFTFVFKGPPGTGKTTTARKVGQIYYDMGLVSEPQVEECSVSDLIGEYLGHTEAKVVRLLDRALGKVLFIDEAYRLAGSSDNADKNLFYQGAIGELVDSITKQKYARKMVIILAGYTTDMDKLMGMNQGLRSRFPTEVIFPRMRPSACLRLLQQKLLENEIEITVEEGSNKKLKVLELSNKLSAVGIDNGRDVETLARSIGQHVLIKAGPDCNPNDPLAISINEVMNFLLTMGRKGVIS
ncbi:hypothetical protein ABW19_dt0207088 [Dactylella cylindrospora]|nr:hypothetical protein ABW19_dt0207088 [Dactylella cylindrospora]